MHHLATAQPLPPRQERAVQALLAAPNVEAAAGQIGVHRATLFRWLNDPAFQNRLQQAQQEATQRATEAVAEQVKLMLAYHTKISRRMLRAASRELNKRVKQVEASEAPVLSVEEIRKLVDTAIKLERLSRGVPTEINENQQTGSVGVALERLSREQRVALLDFYCDGEAPENSAFDHMSRRQ